MLVAYKQRREMKVLMNEQQRTELELRRTFKDKIK